MTPRKRVRTALGHCQPDATSCCYDATPGPGRLHRFARRLYAGQAGGYLAAATALEGVGPCDWQRHVLRRRGKWTLVIDHALVQRPGELLFERHWHLSGRVKPQSHSSVVLAASGAGYVCAFDGPPGRRQWACFLGEPACFLAPFGSRKLLAVTRSGKIFVIDERGHLTGQEDFGTAITGLLRPGDHRAGNRILLGTGDGRVRVLRMQ